MSQNREPEAVAEQLRLSWDEIHGIAEAIPQLGVDEKAFRKGHKYLTLVNDLEHNRVPYVAEDRHQSSLAGFWSTIRPKQGSSELSPYSSHEGASLLPVLNLCLVFPLFFLPLFAPSLLECRLPVSLFSRHCFRAIAFRLGILFIQPLQIAPQPSLLKL